MTRKQPRNPSPTEARTEARTEAGLNRRSMLRAGALGALAAPAMIGPAMAAGEVTWRVQSHWPKASGSFKDSLQVAADLLAETTGGRFKLELFGAGEFAKGPEIYNFVRRGVVPMGTVSPGYIMGEATTAGFALGIPGTFRASWEMQHYLKNLGVETLVNEELNPEGVVYFSEKVYPTELVLSKPVNSLEDFAALKLRSSGTMLDYLAAAGASPSYIPGSELYQSLSSGVVDGAHWGAAIGAKSMSLWEVAKYHMKPPLGVTADAFIVNAKAMDKLPDDLRAHLVSVLQTRFFLRSAEYQHKEAIALTSGVAEQGVTVAQFPDAVLDKFAAASGDILKKEAEKGEKAAAAADALVGLMKDLGYV